MNKSHIHLFAISQIDSIDHYKLKSIYDYFYDISEFWDADISTLSEIFHRSKVNIEPLYQEINENARHLLDAAQNAIELLNNKRVCFLTNKESFFPSSLKSIPDPPSWIFAHGNLDLLHKATCVAVIGTRSPTQYGEKVTTLVTSLLVERGCCIIGGLAEGVDSIAHRYCLDHDRPTIAVLAHGIGEIYPKSNRQLKEDILKSEHGLLVTEYFPGTHINRVNFVKRNRIQTGLSQAVIPIQATKKSGTTHSINHALKQKKRIIGVIHSDYFESQEKQNYIIEVIKNTGNQVFDLKHHSNGFLDYLFEDPSGDIPSTQLSLFS
jgi:DNA processing protein